jgi:hypothetical protein
MAWIVGITTSLIAGLVSGAVVSWIFYRLAGRDLAREAEQLRQLNIMTIDALEAARIAQVTRDATGKPTGLRYTFQVGAQVTVSDEATAVVVPQHLQRSTE